LILNACRKGESAMHPAMLGLATTVPDHRYEQMELYEELMADVLQNRRAPAIFRAAEIETRYSVIPNPQWLAPNPSAQERNDLYMTTAPELAGKAIEAALQRTGLGIDDIDDFIVVSCTGLDTPGLDVVVADQMGCRPSSGERPSSAWAVTA
jgi:alkylresorcinol/alkylpyrone synthase